VEYSNETGSLQLAVTILLSQPHEHRKVKKLLMKLSKMKPISAKPAPIALGKSATFAACTANSQVFFST
jgi:hypothetical protein